VSDLYTVKRQSISLYILLVLLCFSRIGLTTEKKAPVVNGDYLGMAAMLIQDGHYQRALMALENIEFTSEDIDLIRYYTLKGLAFLSLNDLPAARTNLEQAVDSGQQDRIIYLYLAQTYYGLKDYSKTIVAVDKAAEIAYQYPGMAEMKAQSYWQLKDYAKAIDAINKAKRRFPNDHRFLRRQVFYFLELGLYRNAANLGLKYLQQSKAQVKDYIAIGNALRLSRQYTEALRILEIAKLKFPQNSTVAKVLAHTYLDQGKLNIAADIFQQAAIYDKTLLAEASEIYRRAGRYYRALALNRQMTDQKKKYKQRLALLLALKRYETVANMQNTLYRLGLLDEQPIRYALAYANFNIGRYQQVKAHLDHLTDPSLFKKGIELRRLINSCQKTPWQCV